MSRAPQAIFLAPLLSDSISTGYSETIYQNSHTASYGPLIAGSGEVQSAGQTTFVQRRLSQAAVTATAVIPALCRTF